MVILLHDQTDTDNTRIAEKYMMILDITILPMADGYCRPNASHDNSTKRMTRRWPMTIFYNMVDVSAHNALIVWIALNLEPKNTSTTDGKEL